MPLGKEWISNDALPYCFLRFHWGAIQKDAFPLGRTLSNAFQHAAIKKTALALRIFFDSVPYCFLWVNVHKLDFIY